MKRRMFVCGLVVVGATLSPMLPSRAAETVSEALPLQDVVLFSSGVGYFQRAGKINGVAEINLSFRAEQINDILKSLVLLDPTGNVRPVTYTTKDSIARRLNAAGFSLGEDVTLGALLRQFQGARVRLVTGGETVEGRIVSVSLRDVPVPKKDDQVVQIEIINVMTETGLRAISLEQVTRVELLDERLNRELRQSLELLATGLDEQRRTVQLRFDGNTSREVQAGYLQETPVWKTSYRLVLDQKGKDKQKPYLQGWAVVENTTDEDWKDVHLSLVSGRPVSFIQDLYQPLYVPRPVVAPQVVGSPNPQTYGETLEKTAETAAENEGVEEKVADRPARVLAPMAPPMPGPPGPQGPPGTPGSFGGVAGGRGLLREEELRRRQAAGLSAEQLGKSVASQAQGTERGELFEYSIRQPVTLPKQQAALVPIVGENIDGEQLSIYDPAVDTRRALNGFRLKNSTGLHLSGGPITVFQDGVYAGDAQINNVQPGEDRLISYAVDLQLVADVKEPKSRQNTLSISAKSGVLIITRKQQNEQVYTFRNKADQPKTVLLQYRVPGDEWKVVEPAKWAEKTADEYRFKVEVPGQKTTEFKVVAERPITETIALLDADLDLLINYTTNSQVPEKLRASLKELVGLRRKIVNLESQREDLENEIKEIAQEQSRIRQNMGQLDRTSALYQQYVKKLTHQEARIEKVRAEIARLREAELAAEKEMRAFVDKLTIE
ncbi:MAG: DUF4139 domain-containing protein [Armatimonadota bacterium]|nr:DUF4139 domain-containing protein [Armatimonadota bacterium]